MKITEEFINEQRAIAAKATPRPWWRAHHHEETIENLKTWLGQMPLHHEYLTLFMVGAGKFGDDGNEDNIRIPAVTGNGPASEANMDYIVEATNHYLTALDEIELLRAENAKLRAALESLRRGDKEHDSYCKYDGTPNGLYFCTCSAAHINAIIDAALETENKK